MHFYQNAGAQSYGLTTQDGGRTLYRYEKGFDVIGHGCKAIGKRLLPKKYRLTFVDE